MRYIYMYSVLMIICFIIIYEALISNNRRKRRMIAYNQAVNLSRIKHKPLIVIGDPDAGWNSGMDYGCGDVCIDIIGCKDCKKQIIGKAHEVLKRFPNNYGVIFISCVLEYVDNQDLNQTIAQIKRVSGNDIINISVEPYALLNLNFYGTNRLHLRSPPDDKDFKFIEVPFIYRITQFLCRQFYIFMDTIFDKKMKGHYTQIAIN